MRILTVEDESFVALVISNLLEENLEATVDIAPDYASAREFLSSGSNDLITLDYQLPDGDGLSLLQEIVEREGAPPVIMVTGQGDESTAVSAFKLGASGYVVKDARMPTLLIEEARSALARAGQARAEAELRRSREEMQHLFDSMFNAFVLFESVFDGDGDFVSYRFVYINEAYESITGVKNEEVKGRTVHEVWPETEQEWINRYGEVAVSGVTQTFELYHGPTEKLYHCNVYRPWDTNERFCVIFEDITERNRAEEALRKSNEELKGYAHTVSHDIKGPLSAVVTAADFLANILEEEGTGVAEGRGADVLRLIKNSAGRAVTLTNDLLALAEAGQTPAKREPVDISGVLRSILVEKEALLKDRGIRVSLDGDLGVAAMNPTHAYQLFSNLIGNAIKYNDSENPEIHVCRLDETEPGAARYLVRDNGPGIPEAEMEDIFLPFHKEADSTGTGIGLSIVDKVVRLYGGEIRACNDGGACFEFTLPLCFSQGP